MRSLNMGTATRRPSRSRSWIGGSGIPPGRGVRPVLWRFGGGLEVDHGRNFVLGFITFGRKSGRGLPHSKTLARTMAAARVAAVYDRR